MRYATDRPGIVSDCARIALAFAFGAAPGLLAACVPAEAPSHATVSLRLVGTPPDATVVIDDQDIGALGFVESRGVALPPGKHHISVTAPGYFPWDKALDAKPGDPLVRFAVVLVAVPD
jgi:PEGA domain